jgi:ketosteroid isomerase-like protein
MQDIINNQTQFEHIAHQFIAAANRFDTEAVMDLFAPNAVIKDVSVGGKFEGTSGIKKYIVTFFIGYHTQTKLLSFEPTEAGKILAKVDFTGDFGHETGWLDIRFNDAGLIEHIDADLD